MHSHTHTIYWLSFAEDIVIQYLYNPVTAIHESSKTIAIKHLITGSVMTRFESLAHYQSCKGQKDDTNTYTSLQKKRIEFSIMVLFFLSDFLQSNRDRRLQPLL